MTSHLADSLPVCLCQRSTEDLAPLAYWLGHTSAAQNVNQFRRVVSTLAAAVLKRLELDPEVQRGGLIVNTCGWVDGVGYELLQCPLSSPHTAIADLHSCCAVVVCAREFIRGADGDLCCCILTQATNHGFQGRCHRRDW